MRLPIAVLFDCDGVLVESKSAHRTAWYAAFEELTGSALPVYADHQLTGASSLDIARFLCEQTACGVEPQKLADLKLDLMLAGPMPELLPGVRVWFDYLSMAGIPYAVVTNAQRNYLERMLSCHDLSAPVCLAMEDVKATKPAPHPYLKAAEQLGVLPEEYAGVFVFEDSQTGVRSGVSAGMRTYGIAGEEARSVLMELGAVDVFSDLLSAACLIEG